MREHTNSLKKDIIKGSIIYLLIMLALIFSAGGSQPFIYVVF